MTSVLERAPQKRFTFKQRLILAIVPWLVSWIYRALFATCRVEVRGQEILDQLAAENRLALGGFWHETIGIMACIHRNRGYCTLTSISFDGELAARFAQRFGFIAVRGSSSRGGVAALSELEHQVREGPGVAYTLDGPKGPRRKAKAGVAYIAGRTGMPIVPGACAVSRAWRLRSWDRFIIPKPGARILMQYGSPISAPEQATAATARETAERVEQELNRMHEALEAELGLEPQR